MVVLEKRTIDKVMGREACTACVMVYERVVGECGTSYL